MGLAEDATVLPKMDSAGLEETLSDAENQRAAGSGSRPNSDGKSLSLREALDPGLKDPQLLYWPLVKGNNSPEDVCKVEVRLCASVFKSLLFLGR